MNNNRKIDYIKAFGENLRALRNSKKVSMEKLALAAGIEYSQIFDIEHGKINTTISTIHLIATALEIPEKDLFDFTF
ncbi:helix-turn-helix domain-containing protein [Pedobacter sp. LMG 31464]|uniref:Helix-turn-helix domain-containing protein n=1 Tax=Pedobacter planticolens TaxID=2679964 RepID=A0A923DZG7_9SPHI|nr:helix-turn-helix transcriptional regulator [Pedobacter planticolens]MBB2146912.1 helix-turn-helix domain-containing protein [Pedobacter planticolens]